jgi:Rieske Fe-S protein
MNSVSKINRRDFLKLAGEGFLSACAALGLGGLLQYLAHPAADGAPTEFDLGPATDYPPGSRIPIQQANAILFHTGSGFQALSLACTHLGCSVNLSGQGFACPCHNSHYDLNGNVTQGPATKPLQRLEVKVNPQGRLILSTLPS